MTRRPAQRRARPLRARTLAFAVLAAVSVACEGAPDRIVLGVAGGQSFLNAARLAVEDEMAAGPIPGLDTVFVEESSNRSAPALEVAQRLGAEPGMIAVIGHANSASSLVASQVYNDARIVQIAPTSTAEAYSNAGAYSFRMVPPDNRQGPFLADVVADAFADGARVALFYVNDDYGRGLRRAVTEVLDSARFPIVLELPHAEEAVTAEDVRQGLEALAGARADVVLWLGRPQVLVQFLPGLRTRWPDLPIYGGDAVSRALAMPDSQGIWRGIGYTDFVDPTENDRMQAFIERFMRRFGTQASGPEILTYDAARLVLEAVREGIDSGDRLRTYLLTLGSARPPFEGLAGPLTFDEHGDVDRSYVLRFLGGS